MKIISISDIHGNDVSSLIGECDILLICGDISPNNLPHDVATQRGWFRKRFIPMLHKLKEKAKKIVLIAGNHDKYFFDCFQRGINVEIRKELPEGVFYLCGESVVVNGLKIYGNPWCNAPAWAEIGGPVWNFASHNYDFLSAMYADIPDDVDIIMTHGPAYGYCDQILDEGLLANAFEMYKDRLKAEHLGCKVLAKRIEEISDKREKPLLVCSAHIHSADHYPAVYKNTKFICCSILNESYKLGDYKPFEIEIP